MSNSKICIVSLYTPEIEEMGTLALSNKQEYATKHNYDLYFPSKSLAPHRHPVWSKILALEKALNTGKYDWVFWTDADVLFLNQEVKLEDLLKDIPDDKDLIISKDYFSGLNAGNFFLRNTPWTRNLLKEIWEYPNGDSIGLREQEVMRRLTKDDKKLKFVEKRRFNSYLHGLCGGEYQDGDFLLHFACLSERVVPLMRKFSGKDGRHKLKVVLEFIKAFRFLLFIILIIILVFLFRKWAAYPLIFLAMIKIAFIFLYFSSYLNVIISCSSVSNFIFPRTPKV